MFEETAASGAWLILIPWAVLLSILWYCCYHDKSKENQKRQALADSAVDID